MMDPHTGELYDEQQIKELAARSEASAEEIRERLVMIEGSEESISELQTRVRQGAIAERLASDILSVRPKMAVPKSRKPKRG